MKTATIEDVNGLLTHIEGHVGFAREAMTTQDYKIAIQQLEEIEGWAKAAIEVLRTDLDELAESVANALRLRAAMPDDSSEG